VVVEGEGEANAPYCCGIDGGSDLSAMASFSLVVSDHVLGYPYCKNL
jgi:hypothetical protein